MFKCEVIKVLHYRNIQETRVLFRVSDKGNNKTYNHQLTGKTGNRSFIIGEIDKSIKIGDLVRCDGLPFMAKPLNKKTNTFWVKDKPHNHLVKRKHSIDIIPGYIPFQLNSGYWVLRKK